MLDRIAAEVNGEIILYSELRERVFQMKSAGLNRDLSDKEAEAATLEDLIDEKLIIQVGKEEEINISERELDETVERFRKRVGASKEQFEKMLEQEGMNMERYREMLREQILARKVISREVQSQVQLTDDDISEYYETHIDEFKTTPSIQVRHIILLVNKNDTGAGASKALEKIEQIRREIVDGLDFAQAAINYSEGPSGPDGGDLGDVLPGVMVKSFEEAAFSLEPGEISRPVRTEFGYHLIKVDSKKESRQKPLKEVRREIENRIYQKIVSEVRDDWIKRIKQQAFIDIKIEVN
jgi:parvulin-like peptidyl-prolyl isomerase